MAATTTTVGRGVATSSCGSGLVAGLSSTGHAGQLVTVEAPTYAATTATVTLWQRQGPCWVVTGGPWPARIGGTGFSDHHREGDQSTPTGSYTVGPVVYGTAANPGVRYPYHLLQCGDWWDEDPASSAYNTFQHVACGQAPAFGGNSEALWQETTAYKSFAVVDYNTNPTVPGAGSGIFIHADTGSPTAGCVSLPVADLDALLGGLDPAKSPVVVMGPASEITHF
ncbi:MAG: L,D-transpeptidase family protein [Actinomycetota bacterium]|nr:L,D-transpeptidase family protein [Actinomycetota bacterium]